MQQKTVAFTSSYQTLSRVLVNKVHIAQAFSPQISTPISKPTDAREYNALWDTGATGSVITPKVVTECGLNPIGMANIHHAKGMATSNVYLVSVFLPNQVCFTSLRVTEGDLAGDIDVLIGMDIIGRGDFAVTNKDGRTVFTFRMPSIERIDFVQLQNNSANNPSKPFSGVGRNDPCPCGSGKKFKKCPGR